MNAISRRLSLSVKPAALHLGLSATVALLAMALIFLLWYPGALAGLQGVSRLVLMLIGVDVVLGPLITLIVFTPGKKGLKFDLMVIAALQTTALLYGLKAIEDGRPAYVVFNVDRFDVVAVQEVVPDSLARASEGFGVSPFGPRFAAARMPDDAQKRGDIMFSAVQGGADLPQLPEYFVKLEDEEAQMLKRLRPLDELRKLNELDDAAWQALLAEFGKPESELGYLQVVANAKDGVAILDAKTGVLLGLRLLTPRFDAPAKPPADAPRVPLSGPRNGVG
jgi:hypothetical protein